MSRYKEMWSLKHAHTIEEYISFYQQGIDASCISIDKEKELDLFSYLKTRIDNDDTMFLYAVCLERGTGTNKQLNKAIEIYEFLAKKGHAAAQYSLGCCYFNGKGVEYDFDKAIYWFEKSAKEGNLESHNALNKLHNIIELKKKAEIGDSIAAYKMAQNYLTGTIVPLNNYQAFDWCYKSAIAGNIDACYLLGELYTRGKGVDVNNEKAFYWYLKAAERDNSYAQYEVAQCYYNGLGVAKDNNGSV